ncbi:MAG TPA: hypothetical protein VGJ56_18240 [Reyranella sp.]|jgi:hypothetical protein
MRNIGMLISIALVVIIPGAAVSAETWKTQTTLEKERPVQTCTLESIPYTLELTGNTFTATSQYGKMFSIAVPANGEIDKPYRRAGAGATGTVSLRMTGNVKSRELEFIYFACRYKLISDS